MYNFTIFFIIILFIASCSHQKDTYEQCIDTDISFFELETKSFYQICNYKNKLSTLILRDNSINIEYFYEISQQDKEVGYYILQNFNDSKLSLVQKIQMYAILKNIYLYDDIQIESYIGIIDDIYKNIRLPVERIISAENLLVQIFEESQDTIDGVLPVTGGLSGGDIVFLSIIFNLEPERFTSINIVADLQGGYDILSSDEAKKKYIMMLQKLLVDVSNTQSKTILYDFLQTIYRDR